MSPPGRPRANTGVRSTKVVQMSLDRVPAGKDVPNDCNVDHRDPDARGPDQVRGRQGNRRGVRRPLHVDGDALPVQLRLHPAHAVRRRRPVRRARALADAAHHRRRRPLPADRHAEDGRRSTAATPRSSRCRSTSCRRSTGTSSRRATCRELTTRQIAHFFEHYKDLEPGKWVRVSTWVGAEEAKKEITDGVARYAATSAEACVLAALNDPRAGDPVVQELPVGVDERPQEIDRDEGKRQRAEAGRPQRDVGDERRQRADPRGEIAGERDLGGERVPRRRARARAARSSSPACGGRPSTTRRSRGRRRRTRGQTTATRARRSGTRAPCAVRRTPKGAAVRKPTTRISAARSSAS